MKIGKDKVINKLMKGIGFWLLILLILAAGGGFFLIKKINSSKENLKSAYHDYYTTLNQLSSFNTLQDDYASLMERKKTLENMRVSKANSLDLIEDLEKAAVLSDVKLTTSVARPEDLVAKKAKKKEVEDEDLVILKLDAEGNYNNVLDFLKRIENGEKIVFIRNIKINQVAKVDLGELNPLEIEEQELKQGEVEETEETNTQAMGELRAEILISNKFK